MTKNGYAVLGWTVWQVGSRVAKRKMAQNRVKLGALGVVARGDDRRRARGAGRLRGVT